MESKDSMTLHTVQAAQALQHIAHEQGKSLGEWVSTSGTDLSFDYNKVVKSSSVAADLREPISLPKKNISELLCHIHSDIAEAFHGSRLHTMDDELPARTRLESKLAKAVVRIFDAAGGMKLDLAGAIADRIKVEGTPDYYKRQIRSIYARAELDRELDALLKRSRYAYETRTS